MMRRQFVSDFPYPEPGRRRVEIGTSVLPRGLVFVSASDSRAGEQGYRFSAAAAHFTPQQARQLAVAILLAADQAQQDAA